MELNKVNYYQQENKYVLNSDQYFYFNNQLVKEQLDQIQFPILIMDTEFFNRSHEDNLSRETVKNPLYNDQIPDLIYTLSYSLAKSYEDLLKRDNEKNIQSLSIKRRLSETNFDFKKEMNQILIKFFNYAFKHKVKTLIFAGKANDEKILNNWINQNHKLVYKKLKYLTTKVNQQESKLNILDIYPILEQGLSYHDDPNHETKAQFKKGEFEDTVQLPSLKHFHESINLFPEIGALKENTDIYNLCVNVLKLYSFNKLDLNQFRTYQTSYHLAVKHCRHDVFKLVTLIAFLYAFANKPPQANPFVDE